MRSGRGRAWMVVVLVGVASLPVVDGDGAHATAAADARPSGEQRGVVPDQYLVAVVGDESPEAVADEHRQRHGARTLHVYDVAFRGYAARMSARQAQRVSEDARVEFVEQDRVVSIAAQTIPTGVDRVDADASPTAKLNGSHDPLDVDIAIVDTGIQGNHPDLNVVRGHGCVPHEAGWSDRNGHGTHVAGIAAARDNGIGVVGVAPGARLYAVKVLDRSGSGTWSSVICGINWIANTSKHQPIEVANMSLSGWGFDGPCSDSSLHLAICRSVDAGITYVVAAGNNASDANDVIPATYREVITVSATADFDGRPGALGAATCWADDDDTFADFSNFGPDIDLAAPGVCIDSTTTSSGYQTLTGTSMAAPHVAGGAALYKVAHRTAPPATVRNALRSAAVFNWKVGTDPDGVADPLLRVARL